mgnify:CR=1 FL=1
MDTQGSTSPDNAEFSNQSLTDEQLPSLSTLTYQGLAPIYLKTRRFVSLFSTTVILLILVIGQYQPFFPFFEDSTNLINNLILTVALLGVWHYLYIILADKKKHYALREQDITYRSGLIFQKTVIQPILRIQHVELKRGPIERKVGLACIQLFSAGGAAYTFEIPGLLLENAESMQAFILDHKAINN